MSSTNEYKAKVNAMIDEVHKARFALADAHERFLQVEGVLRTLESNSPEISDARNSIADTIRTIGENIDDALLINDRLTAYRDFVL